MIHVVAGVTMCEHLVSQNLNSLPQRRCARDETGRLGNIGIAGMFASSARLEFAKIHGRPCGIVELVKIDDRRGKECGASCSEEDSIGAQFQFPIGRGTRIVEDAPIPQTPASFHQRGMEFANKIVSADSLWYDVSLCAAQRSSVDPSDRLKRKFRGLQTFSPSELPKQTGKNFQKAQ